MSAETSETDPRRAGAPAWAGPALIAAAVAAGAWASTWREAEPWRLGVALVAIAALAAPLRLRRRLTLGSRPLASAAWIALALASLSQSVAADLWRFVSTPEVRVWNVYHYYLGAKYFDELGYHDLYDATLAADRAGADYWADIDRVRNLHSYEVEPRRLADRRYEPEAHFSPARWRELQRDVAALQTQLPAASWRGIFRDRGYNPSPFWTVWGRFLAELLPATQPAALKLLCALDLALLAGTFVLVGRVFGVRAAALVLLLFTLTPVNDDRLVGGFLQYDWFCALAAGFCLLRRDRPWPAGALVAYAVLARLFPAIFVVSAAVPLAVAWVRTGKVRRVYRSFFLALAVCGALGLAAGTLTADGPAAWRDFVGNLRHHSAEHVFGERRIGLQHVFTHEVTDLSLDLGDLDLGTSERREHFAAQRPLYLACAALLAALYLAAVLRRPPVDAFLFGLLPLFAAAVSSRYYWSYLALLPLLTHPGPPGRRRLRILTAAQAAVYAGYALFALSDPERYAAYTVLNLFLAAFFLLLVALYLWRDVQVLRRWRARRLAAAAR